MGGELVDVDAAVGENASVAVDPADGTGGGDDAFEAAGRGFLSLCVSGFGGHVCSSGARFRGACWTEL